LSSTFPVLSLLFGLIIVREVMSLGAKVQKQVREFQICLVGMRVNMESRV